MSDYLPTMPRAYGGICCFPPATYVSPTTKRRSRLVMVGIVVLATAIITVLSIYYGGDTPLYQVNPIPPVRSYYTPLSIRNEDCSDQAVVNQKVREGARAQRFMHPFEFQKSSPCCYNPSGAKFNYQIPTTSSIPWDPLAGNDALTPADITFLILTSKSSLEGKGRGAGASWARGLPNVVFSTDSFTGDTLRSDSTRPSLVAHHRRELGALRYLVSKTKTESDSSRPYTPTKWTFVVSDTTWVNVPVLLETLSKFSHLCPVTIGGVRSNSWFESFDFAALYSGVAFSYTAVNEVGAKLLSETCTYSSSISIAMSRCIWGNQVQLLHSSNFSSSAIPRSNDRYQQIDVTSIAERASSPDVSVADMKFLTTYSYARYGYDPTGLLIVDTDRESNSTPPVVRDYEYPVINVDGDAETYSEKDYRTSTIKITAADIKSLSGPVNTGLPSTKGMMFNETTPFDANRVLYDNPLVPVIMYPDHLYENSNLLQNAKVGYEFLEMPYPPNLFPPQK